MERELGHLRWDRLERVRERLNAGFYDDPLVWDGTFGVHGCCTDDLIRDYASCPAGHASAGRFVDQTAAVLVGLLGEVTNAALLRREFRVSGVRGDCEIPIRISQSAKFPIISDLSRRYSLRAFLVECKNYSEDPIRAEDVAQALSYLELGSMGSVALLVGRNGLTSDARKSLSTLAKNNRFLILPFDHLELVRLARACWEQPGRFLEILSTKEDLLRQAA